MIAPNPAQQRIVITGIGLTAPGANHLVEFRENLLEGRSGISPWKVPYIGETFGGVCDFDQGRYQTRKEVRRGTRAGSIAVYCAARAVDDAGLDWENIEKSRIGVYVGVTEHGNVETEAEIEHLHGNANDPSYWPTQSK